MRKKNDVQSAALQCNGGEKTGMGHNDIGASPVRKVRQEQEMISSKKVIGTCTRVGY